MVVYDRNTLLWRCNKIRGLSKEAHLMPTKKTAKKVVAKKEKPKYDLTVRMNDEVFSCSTDDIIGALQELSPTNIKTRVIIRIENAFSAIERIMMVRRAKLLFRNKLSMESFVKNVLVALKNE